MRIKYFVCLAGLALCCLAASAARSDDGWSATVSPPKRATISDQKLAQLVPGRSTKSQVESLLGAPWRVVQFNDCGMSMPGQADETWDYRGRDSTGSFRVHIEFDDRDVASLVAKIPDRQHGGKGTPARVSPSDVKMAMKM